MAANSELSRCFTATIRSSHSKPIANTTRISLQSRKFPLLSTPKPRSVSVASSAGSSSGGLTYKEAGVDIDAGTELVRRIAKMAPGIGGFGGLFPFGISSLLLFLVSLSIFSLTLSCLLGEQVIHIL